MKVRTSWALGFLAVTAAAAVATAAPSQAAQLFSPTIPPSWPAAAVQPNSQLQSATFGGQTVIADGRTLPTVSADWLVPAIETGGSQANAVGLAVSFDGYRGTPVEQLAVRARWNPGSRTISYAAWYRAAGAPVPLLGTIHAGDHISAQIWATGGGSYQYSLSNVTRNWTDNVKVQDGAADPSSADVGVVAVPTDTSGYYPLSDFGTVAITNARIGWPMGSWLPDSVVMAGSTPMAVPSPFATTGSGAYLDFTVAWQHA